MTAKELVQAAQATLGKANADVSGITAGAKAKAKGMTDEATARLDSAAVEAGKIVETAHKRAEEIAGSAYQAMNNANLYEQTAQAMKKIIEGYGNKYIIPEHSFLDDLAEEFGFAEAGQGSATKI